MGAALIRSAHSANIKERRDASTALFDAAGEMVMQAEHIPVHLGAMPAAVAAVLDERHARGVSWILNDPYAGGTHLPDITVITPLFADGELIAFAASRAHHADVGGRTPGSMPADSRTLAGRGRGDLAAGARRGRDRRLTRPMRQPDQRRADLRAQLAANRVGAARLLELHQRVSAPTSCAAQAFAEVLDYGERRTRACIEELDDGSSARATCSRRARVTSQLRLRAIVAGDAADARLHRHRCQHEGNLNCPLAVTRSACLFAIRVLTDPDIPPSAGAYRPLELIAPEGCLLNARPRRRRGGRQRRDLLARGRRRAERLRARAGPGHDEQPDARQRALRLLRDDRRRSGRLPGRRRSERRARGDEQHAEHPDRGARARIPAARDASTRCAAARAALARHRGGDGVMRELQALEPMSYSLITERRRHAPARARTVARTGAAGATCSTARSSRARHRHARAGGSGCASRRPVVEDGAMARAERIGFLGLGIMGSRMAANVARAGFELNVWTHTPGKAAALGRRQHGARAHDTPAEVAAASDIVVSMVVDGEQVASVLLGAGGVIESARAGAAVRGHVHDRARRRARQSPPRWQRARCGMLDAPVTGSSPRAQDGHAHDHGRRRARGRTSVRSALLEAMGAADRARGRARRTARR